MSNSDFPDQIFGRALIAAETLASQWRREIWRSASEAWTWFDPYAAPLRVASGAIRDAAAAIADHSAAVNVAALLAGSDDAADRVPEWWWQEILPIWSIGEGSDDGGGFDIAGAFAGDESPGELVFPKIREAARRLEEREAVTRDQFDAMTDAARRESFTLAGNIETETIGRVRDALANNVAGGASLRGFQASLDETLEASFMGPGHIETVYRTSIHAAYRDGRETIMANPIDPVVFDFMLWPVFPHGTGSIDLPKREGANFARSTAGEHLQSHHGRDDWRQVRQCFFDGLPTDGLDRHWMGCCGSCFFESFDGFNCLPGSWSKDFLFDAPSSSGQ